MDTNSDYRVLPVVGLVRPSFVWQPDHREVSEVFTIPLKLAVNRNEYTHKEFVHKGESVIVSSMHWRGHRIWGITAAILLNLGSRIERQSLG